MMRSSTILGALAGLAFLHQAQAAEPPVVDLDVDRYVGTWYSIAHFPTRFEKGCENTTATYSKRDDGRLTVENRCTKKGEPSGVKGKAWAPDPKQPGKLKVQFFWPFSGDYWVHAVGPDYEWALVGNRDRSNAWILSRTPTMDAETYDALVSKLKGVGYDVSKLERIKHTDAAAQAK